MPFHAQYCSCFWCWCNGNDDDNNFEDMKFSKSLSSVKIVTDIRPISMLH